MSETAYGDLRVKDAGQRGRKSQHQQTLNGNDNMSCWS